MASVRESNISTTSLSGSSILLLSLPFSQALTDVNSLSRRLLAKERVSIASQKSN